ncbi:MAG: hypothetical protein SFU20_07590, partial [Chitinophagaceae bacterium]|nr:hypothetical protein [Chitinophagaceae bacterium]
ENSNEKIKSKHQHNAESIVQCNSLHVINFKGNYRKFQAFEDCRLILMKSVLPFVNHNLIENNVWQKNTLHTTHRYQRKPVIPGFL